ncbi:MAG: tetratricopeptide repeat protein [Buchnera aphidicola (Periphyllus aceris)]|nr:tetratricopeptide repeat protein [Buchnera aphidicola (Periphyllus aceris)]
MKFFSNIDFSKITILEVFLLSLEKIKVNFSKDSFILDLKNKLVEAKKYLHYEEDQQNKLKKLLELFYFNWNFREITGRYNLSDVLWLDKVLKTRKGTAISLGIILLYFSKKLKINLNPVLFPTQFILRFEDYSDRKVLLINPFNGNFLDNHILKLWLKGNLNFSKKNYFKYIEKSKSNIIFKKILNILKSSLLEEKKIELALKVSQILLEIEPNNPYEIRDRGLIYSQLECYSVARNDLLYFLEKCPNDPINDIIRLKIESIKNEDFTLN